MSLNILANNHKKFLITGGVIQDIFADRDSNSINCGVRRIRKKLKQEESQEEQSGEKIMDNLRKETNNANMQGSIRRIPSIQRGVSNEC